MPSPASDEADEAAILHQIAARTAAHASPLVQFSLGEVGSGNVSSSDDVQASLIHIEGLREPVARGEGQSRSSGPSSQLTLQGADDGFSAGISSVSSSVSSTRFISYVAYLRQSSVAGGVVRVQVVDQAADDVLILHDASKHMEWVSSAVLLVPPPRQPNRAAPVARALSRTSTPSATPSKLGTSAEDTRPLTPTQDRLGVATVESSRRSGVSAVTSQGQPSQVAAEVSPLAAGVSNIVWPTLSTPMEFYSPAPQLSTYSGAVSFQAPPPRADRGGGGELQ